MRSFCFLALISNAFVSAATAEQRLHEGVSILGTPSRQGLAAIAEQWRARESRLGDVSLHGSVFRHLQSTTFVNDASVHSIDREREIDITIGADSCSMSATCSPTVRLGELGVFSSVEWSGPRGASMVHEFNEAIQTRFSAPFRIRIPQPYSALVTRQLEIHYWAANTNAYPRAFVTDAGVGGRPPTADPLTAPPVPLQFAVLDAVLIALRPSWSNGGLGEIGSLLSVRRQIAGRECLIVVIKSAEGGERRLWIDSERECLVVRNELVTKSGAAWRQYNIDYDRQEGRWLPREVTVLQMNDSGDPQDEIAVALTAASSKMPVARGFDVERLPPGTWIVDYLTGEQYVSRPDGRHRPVTVSEIVEGRIVAEETSGQIALSPLGASSGPSLMLQLALWPVSWPGVVVTIISLCFCTLVLKGRRRSIWRSR